MSDSFIVPILILIVSIVVLLLPLFYEVKLMRRVLKNIIDMDELDESTMSEVKTIYDKKQNRAGIKWIKTNQESLTGDTQLMAKKAMKAHLWSNIWIGILIMAWIIGLMFQNK